MSDFASGAPLYCKNYTHNHFLVRNEEKFGSACVKIRVFLMKTVNNVFFYFFICRWLATIFIASKIISINLDRKYKYLTNVVL